MVEKSYEAGIKDGSQEKVMSHSFPMSSSASPHGLTTFCATRKQKIRFSLQGSFQDRRSTQIKERSVNNRYTDLDSSMVSVSVCGLILYLSAVSFSTRARGARILNMTLILVHSHQTTENSGTVPVR